jgi:hypothetical protein
MFQFCDLARFKKLALQYLKNGNLLKTELNKKKMPL